MKNSFRQNVMIFYCNLATKYKFLKIPSFCCLCITLGVNGAFHNLFSGWKRYACTAFVLMCFMVGSSFAYPVFATEDGFIAEESDRTQSVKADESVTLATENEATLQNMTILDDDDVLNGYDDAELHDIENVDRYSVDEILEENDVAEQETDLPKEEAEETVCFRTDDWRLVLINKQHPIPDDYTFTLGKIKENMQCDERIIPDLMTMLQAAKADGVNLVICSPYRDLNRQEILFNRKIKAYMNKGMSYMEAYKLSSQAVTVPGASEHQIGLALDIVSDSYVSLDEGFGDTEAGKWLAEHSCEYGFILRYPLGKEYITSIEYEPWHFRYVGKDAAMLMTEQKITLEEFVEKYL